jgi:hypothetical protein
MPQYILAKKTRATKQEQTKIRESIDEIQGEEESNFSRDREEEL